MENNLLLQELSLLQEEYKKILIKASIDFLSINTEAVIDEINVFWLRNKKLVHCILKYLSEPYKSYVFTAAAILDINDYEHFPFISLGTYHFWDDPIYKYAKISKKLDNTSWGGKLKEQVLSTILDNIKIIENTNGFIYILPIRLFADEEAEELIQKAASQAFLSMFKEKITMEEYRSKYKTIQDIKEALAPGVEKSIILSEDDDNSLDLEIRFSQYIDLNEIPLSTNATEAEVFRFRLYGFLSQAFDVMLMCTEHRLIPYIRFNVALKYLLIFAGNFRDSMELSDMLFKSAVAHIVHHSFDKERINGIDFKTYCDYIRLYDFENKLFRRLDDNGITLLSPSVIKTESIIIELFNEIFDALHHVQI
jgi:hypothetical protein